MLLSEFETHTGIFPDVLLYEAAEHEYNDGGWESKAGFCHDFKFNVDGIAQKCQRIANERWIAVNEEASRLRSEAKPLADICEKLPEVEKTFSATEVGEMLGGLSANKIGKTANANGLKTEEYGITVLDKSPYSAKQVATFRYNQKGVEKLAELLGVSFDIKSA